MSETLEIPTARIPSGTPWPAPRKPEPPDIVHFYEVTHQRYRLGQCVPFLCGDVGTVDYRGIGQHRPVPQVGTMVTTSFSARECIDCRGLYDEEIAPRTLEVHVPTFRGAAGA